VLWSPIQAPLIEIGSMYVPFTPFEQTTQSLEPSTVYSFALNNIWDTNFPYQQGGEVILQYGITSYVGPFEYRRAYAFGAACINPLRSLWGAYPLSAASNSLIRLSGSAADHVQLLALRPAQTKDSAIQLRFQEIAGQSGELCLELPGINIAQAWLTDLTGKPRKELEGDGDTIIVPITPGAVMTIVVQVKETL
jgi:hypothetical protein